MARVVLGVALLVVLAVAVAPSAAEAARELPWALARMEPGWVLAAALCQGAVYVGVAAIIRCPLRALGYGIRACCLLYVAFAFLFANRALPGPAVAGLAVLVFLLDRQNVPPEAAQAAAAIFYVADYAAFLILALILGSGLALSGRLGVFDPEALVLAAVAILASAVAATLLYRTPAAVRRLAARVSRHAARALRRPDPEALTARVVAGVDVVYAQWRAVTAQPRILGAACAWAGAMHLAEVAALMCAARAFGAHVALGIAATGYVTGNVAAIVSFLPGGLGSYEGAMVASLHALGHVPLPAAMAATLLYRLLSVWLPLPIGLNVARQALRPAAKKKSRARN